MTTPYTDTSIAQEDDDTRSEDSDSEGSLVDFIVKDDDSEDESRIEEMSDPPQQQPEHITLLEEFPYDRKLLEEDQSNGPRRSKRKRSAVTRYRDPEYEKLMFDDVDKEALVVDSSSDKEAASESEFEGSSDESDDSSVEETTEGDFAYDE
jgi:hypothetical protein